MNSIERDVTKYCYLCLTPLVNKSVVSKEHIIPEALGGILCSKDLLCAVCNSHFGNTIDIALIEEMRPIQEVLDLSTSKSGKPNPVLMYDDEIKKEVFIQNGKPTLKRTKPKIEIIDNQLVITGEVRSIYEIRSLLEGLKRKYPQIDIEEVLRKHADSLVPQPKLVHGDVNVSFGSIDGLRGIVKILVNLFIVYGGKIQEVSHLFPFLKRDRTLNIVSVSPSCFTYAPTETELSHVLHLRADSKTGYLVGYIDLYNVFDCIILLGQEYSGPNMEVSYIFDLKQKSEIKRNILFDYTNQDIISSLKEDPSDKHVKRLEHVRAKFGVM